MRSARPLALALLLTLVGNSGGIVGLITARLGRSRAAFRLGLATLKILPQRGAQTLPLPHPGCALGINVHGTNLGTGDARRKAFGALIRHLPARACAIFALMARIGALAAAFHSCRFRLRPGAAVAQW